MTQLLGSMPVPLGRTVAATAIASLLAGACQSPMVPSPTTVATSPSLPASASAQASRSPSPVAGGCGSTQVFAGPGPDAALGLADNPWADASPAEVGIIAYFWYPPPSLLFAQGPNERTKVLWVNHGESGGHLIIAAHPLNASTPVVHFDFPGGGGGTPSSIDVPSAGCWRLELAIGTERATIDIMVAPASST